MLMNIQNCPPEFQARFGHVYDSLKKVEKTLPNSDRKILINSCSRFFLILIELGEKNDNGRIKDSVTSERVHRMAIEFVCVIRALNFFNNKHIKQDLEAKNIRKNDDCADLINQLHIIVPNDPQERLVYTPEQKAKKVYEIIHEFFEKNQNDILALINYKKNAQ